MPPSRTATNINIDNKMHSHPTGDTAAEAIKMLQRPPSYKYSRIASRRVPIKSRPVIARESSLTLQILSIPRLMSIRASSISTSNNSNSMLKQGLMWLRCHGTRLSPLRTLRTSISHCNMRRMSTVISRIQGRTQQVDQLQPC